MQQSRAAINTRRRVGRKPRFLGGLLAVADLDSQPFVLALKNSFDDVTIGRFFVAGLGVPLAASGIEEVPTVDVNTTCKSQERVCNGMDSINRQRCCITLEQGLRTKCLNVSFRFTPQQIVFAASVLGSDHPSSHYRAWIALTTAWF
jgi:hypothetical protein